MLGMISEKLEKALTKFAASSVYGEIEAAEKAEKIETHARRAAELVSLKKHRQRSWPDWSRSRTATRRPQPRHRQNIPRRFKSSTDRAAP